MKCASCSSEMDKKQQDGVVIDMCGSCGGVFFDPGELGETKGVDEMKLWSRTVSRDADARIECPRCRLHMHATDLGGIMIEGCTNCGGFWLDWPSVYALTRDRTEHDESQSDGDRKGWFFGSGVAATFVERLFG